MVAVLLLVAAAGSQAQCGGGGPAGPGSAPGIPASLLGIYDQAAGAYQLGPQGWAYLAAINYVETRFGQDLSPSSQGAIGWMQFEPGTWAQYEVSADPSKPGAPPDPYDPGNPRAPGPPAARRARRQPAAGARRRYARSTPDPACLSALTRWQRAAGKRERHRRTKHLPGDQHPRSGPRELARGGAALRRMSATNSTRPAHPARGAFRTRRA